MKDSKFNSEQVPFEPKYDDIKKKVNVNKYVKNRTIGSQRKGFMWLIILIVFTPVLFFLCMGLLIIPSTPNSNDKAISNFLREYNIHQKENIMNIYKIFL